MLNEILTINNNMTLNTIKEAIKDIKSGKMVIVIDNEDRENEGDFIIASEKCRVEDVNFMMKEGRGLICISINNDTAIRLVLITPCCAFFIVIYGYANFRKAIPYFIRQRKVLIGPRIFSQQQ